MSLNEIIAIANEMKRRLDELDRQLRQDDPPCPKCGSLTFSMGRGKMVCQTCPWEENKEEA